MDTTITPLQPPQPSASGAAPPEAAMAPPAAAGADRPGATTPPAAAVDAATLARSQRLHYLFRRTRQTPHVLQRAIFIYREVPLP